MNNEKIYAKSGCSVLGGKTKKACPSTKQGSILAYSLIILSIMLVIATSVSKSAILGKKGASATEASVQSLQTADSGVQLAMKELDTYPGNGNITAALGNAFGSCSVSTFTSDDGVAGPAGSVFKLTFFDQTGNSLDCNAPASDVANIKSIGTYENTVRAVSVDVAAALAQCDASTPPSSPCSFGGLTYIPITGVDGEVWLDRNLGAAQLATSSTDIDAYGWLYQWGRESDGHQYTAWGGQPSPALSAVATATAIFSNTDTVPAPNDVKFIRSLILNDDWRNPQNNSLWQGVSGTNNPCPPGFRIPLRAEWVAVNITDSDSAYATLKLTMAGYRRGTNSLLGGQDTTGYYWASDSDIAWPKRSYQLYFFGSGVNMSLSTNRSYGGSVRCIRD